MRGVDVTILGLTLVIVVVFVLRWGFKQRGELPSPTRLSQQVPAQHAWRVTLTNCLNSPRPSGCVRLELYGSGKKPTYVAEFQGAFGTNWQTSWADDDHCLAQDPSTGAQILLEHKRGQWESRVMRR